MVKALVFDLGGTLMEYRGMPLNWSDYYIIGFERVNETLGLNLSERELQEAAAILTSYNPRISRRQNEIEPTVMFSNVIANWKNKPKVNEVITIFFEGLSLKADIYDYSAELLKKCKNAGYKIACLTDLPNGMPDNLFKAAIAEIIDYFDLYVSSQSCGVRKPDSGGLSQIARIFHISESEILFIGDEEKDLLTAQNAGCDFIYMKDFLSTQFV